jgi:hypothetical protein
VCHRHSRVADLRTHSRVSLRIRFDTSNGRGDNALVPAATLDARVKDSPPRSTPRPRAADEPATATYAAVALVPAVPGKNLLTYRITD